MPILPSLLLLAVAGTPSPTRPLPVVQAGSPRRAESDYLQRRAAELNQRVASARQRGKITRRKAASFRLEIRRVQTEAGNLQARGGTIERPDADRLNQRLTDIERAFTGQR